MNNISKITKKIDEVRYLTAENAHRYRMIMRCFFLQYERMKYWLYKEDIYDEMMKYGEFQGYTIEECRSDLDSLVNWKNLIPVQDTSKVATVEEFKNKQFRYRMSEYSVEIERMTISLESTFEKNASLEASLLDRIREELKLFKTIIKEDNKKVAAWWNNINRDFKRLNENYQDYIGNMYSLKAEEMMKTKEFLIFKDQFIQYLREFIKGLQENVYAIESIINDFVEREEEEFIIKVVEHEKSIPRLEKIDEDIIIEEITSRWKNIKQWFLGKNTQESEATKLFDITNEIIRKITRYAFQISESSNSSANRKEEYRKMAKLFLSCNNIEEAHRLSSLTFGIFNMMHIRGEDNRETESVNSGIFDEKPLVMTIKPRIRTYREKTARNFIKDNSTQKDAIRKSMLDKIKMENEVFEGFINNKIIDFTELPVIEGKTRNNLLRWLSKGLLSESRIGKTEDGKKFKVIEPENKECKCVMKCIDGDFVMPAFVIEFIE